MGSGAGGGGGFRAVKQGLGIQGDAMLLCLKGYNFLGFIMAMTLMRRRCRSDYVQCKLVAIVVQTANLVLTCMNMLMVLRRFRYL